MLIYTALALTHALSLVITKFSAVSVNIQLTAQLLITFVILFDLIPVCWDHVYGVHSHISSACFCSYNNHTSFNSSAVRSSKLIAFQSASLTSHVEKLILFQFENHLNSHLTFLSTSTSHGLFLLCSMIKLGAENISNIS